MVGVAVGTEVLVPVGDDIGVAVGPGVGVAVAAGAQEAGVAPPNAIRSFGALVPSLEE